MPNTQTMTDTRKGSLIMEAYKLGSRVVILDHDDEHRGKIGWIRGVMFLGKSAKEHPFYLVTDTLSGTSVGDWWTEIGHEDLTVIEEPK